MYTAVIIIHVLVSIVLIVTVLLQSGKGASIGASFGGAGSQTLFGSAGPAGLLVKRTIACAVIFMATSLYMTLNTGRSSATSVMSDVTEVKGDEKAKAKAEAAKEAAAKKEAVDKAAEKKAEKAEKPAPIKRIEETALKPAPIVGKEAAPVEKKAVESKKAVTKKAAPVKKEAAPVELKTVEPKQAAPVVKETAPAPVVPAQ
ncbi:MAG: preprotein translocase subunit SecG [Thermodesulfobacteriota bacterium]